MFEKNTVCNDYGIAHHVDKLCFLPDGFYHNKEKGHIDQLPLKWDTLLFTYQQVNSLSKYLNYQSSGNVVAQSR